MKRFFILFLFLAHSLGAFQYELAVCAIFQNEARFMKEWIDYHESVGVEHFILFNNRSQDNFREVLAPYIKAGKVTLINWPYYFPGAKSTAWDMIQCSAYSRAVKMSRGIIRWLAVIDLDEFIIPVQKKTITEVLKDYKAASGIAVNWQMYGTSSVAEVPEGQRMTYSLLMRAEDDAPEHHLIKSIVQPVKTKSYVINPHFFSYKKSGYCQNTDGVRVDGPLSPYVAKDVLRINHYWTRDEKFLYERKVARRKNFTNEDLEHILRNNERFNVVYDDIILNKW